MRTADPKKVVHCWEDGPRTDDDCGTTCMLMDGHKGPHEWSRDDGITLSFPPIPKEPEPPTSIVVNV